jgi:hypothetical protein
VVEHGTPYGEEERLYAPPTGTFDPEWVVRLARSRSPSVPWPLAYRLTEHTWRHLVASPQLAPEELAAYCEGDEPEASAVQAQAVVDAALDFCDAFAVEPDARSSAPLHEEPVPRRAGHGPRAQVSPPDQTISPPSVPAGPGDDGTPLGDG